MKFEQLKVLPALNALHVAECVGIFGIERPLIEVADVGVNAYVQIAVFGIRQSEAQIRCVLAVEVLVIRSLF